MFVTSDDQRAGLLVAIISGGRPTLKQRPTHKFIDSLKAAGVNDVVWVVSDHEADGYEPHPGSTIITYTRDWAYEHAKHHWMLPTPPEPDGFYGAFPGREAACQEAERRGCWGVLQLDDNLIELTFMRRMKAGTQLVKDQGGLGLFADLLAGVALSTNAMTTGAQLSAVGAGKKPVVARPGFPYSCFVEKVGPAREPWYGPYEDDITHAFQYGTRADGVTAAVVPMIQYTKEGKSKDGMRSQYNHERSLQLQRLIPQGAKVGVRATKSNGMGGPRVFHTMLAGAIRNPLKVTIPGLFARARARLGELTTEWFELEKAENLKKVTDRLTKHERKQ